MSDDKNETMSNILYLCDRQQCEECHEECAHTTDINHAVNFVKVDDYYWEKMPNGQPRDLNYFYVTSKMDPSDKIKEWAKKLVDRDGHRAYHFLCYDCAFWDESDRPKITEGILTNEQFDETLKRQIEWDYPLIHEVVREMKRRGLWIKDD